MTVDGHMKSKRICCAYESVEKKTVLGHIKIGCEEHPSHGSRYCNKHLSSVDSGEAQCPQSVSIFPKIHSSMFVTHNRQYLSKNKGQTKNYYRLIGLTNNQCA